MEEVEILCKINGELIFVVTTYFENLLFIILAHFGFQLSSY